MVSHSLPPQYQHITSWYMIQIHKGDKRHKGRWIFDEYIRKTLNTKKEGLGWWWVWIKLQEKF